MESDGCASVPLAVARRAHMLAYFDDWLFVASSPVEARRVAVFVLSVCAEARTYCGEPRQESAGPGPAATMIALLGFLVDLQAGAFEVPLHR